MIHKIPYKPRINEIPLHQELILGANQELMKGTR